MTGLEIAQAGGACAFTEEEHRRRVSALQTGMAREGFDGLLLSGAADIFYVTGFLTRFWESPTRPWFVVVPAKGDPVAVIPSIGAALMGRSWLSDIRTWPSPRPEDEGISQLIEALGDVTPGNGRIGAPLGQETRLGLPLLDFERVRTALAPRRIVDATALLREARAVKSEAEIARMAQAVAAADAAFETMGRIAAPGVALSAVFREVQIACLAAGADWVAYLAGAAGPDGYQDVIAPADESALSVGDVLMLDLGAVSGGYYCDFGRNIAIGPASLEAHRAYAALFAATEAGIAAARPGAEGRQVHAAMIAAIEEAGFAPLEGRHGHGIGLALTEPPSLTAADETVLREGMTLAIEPGLMIGPQAIMVHEENIVVRSGGGALLGARAPEALPETSGAAR
ncbi:MAG: Xaa-Pro peptidase family protein [Pseudomonadota bacterium]